MPDSDEWEDSLRVNLVNLVNLARHTTDEAAPEAQDSEEKAYRQLRAVGVPVLQSDLLTFVMISAGSGIIGNVSYDMLKAAFRRTVKEQTQRRTYKVIEDIAIEAIRAYCAHLGWGIPPGRDFYARVRFHGDGNYEDECIVDVRNQGLYATVVVPGSDEKEKRDATVMIHTMPYEFLPHEIQEQFLSNMLIFNAAAIVQNHDVVVDFITEREVYEYAFWLAASGGVNEASALYQQVIDSGHPVLAPMAAYRLGILLGDQGNLAGAQAAFQRAMNSDDTKTASQAAVRLGLLLKDHDDVAGAQAAFQRAMNSDDTKTASIAAFWLGSLLADQNNIHGARNAYQKAMDLRDTDLAPRAAYELGVLFETQGDIEKAKSLYQRVIYSRHLLFAPTAAIRLGILLGKQGDIEGAQAAYQRAIMSGNTELALLAEAALKDLLNKVRRNTR